MSSSKSISIHKSSSVTSSSSSSSPRIITASSATSTSTDVTASSIHCVVCFDTLVNYFNDSSSSSSSSSSFLASPTSSVSSASICSDRIPPIANHIRSNYGALFTSSCPLFITLKVRDKGSTSSSSSVYTTLRGCIGSLTPRSLLDIPKYTLKSAFEDKRFSPLTRKELPFLQISLSLLINYEKINQWNDWIIGKHGILIEFTIDNRTYNGTFLPEVAKEQNWDHEETMDALIRKTGYTTKKLKDYSLLRVTRYQSSKTRLTYEEYRRIKEEEEQGKTLGGE